MEAQRILTQQHAAAAADYLTGNLTEHRRDTEIMLRLGLARAFSGPQNWHPMRCYLQCNGFLFP
jgi:hypothetical protein